MTLVDPYSKLLLITCDRNVLTCDRNLLTCDCNLLTCDRNLLTCDRNLLTCNRNLPVLCGPCAVSAFYAWVTVCKNGGRRCGRGKFLSVYCFLSLLVLRLLNIYFPTIVGNMTIDLAPVVQRLDNAIHRINHYPVDKCWQNKPRYPLDSDLSNLRSGVPIIFFSRREGTPDTITWLFVCRPLIKISVSKNVGDAISR